MALITAFTWSGIDLMRFTRVSRKILDQALITTSVNCSIDEEEGIHFVDLLLKKSQHVLDGRQVR